MQNYTEKLLMNIYNNSIISCKKQIITINIYNSKKYSSMKVKQNIKLQLINQK